MSDEYVDKTIYKVVMNHEEQYSLCLRTAKTPWAGKM